MHSSESRIYCAFIAFWQLCSRRHSVQELYSPCIIGRQSCSLSIIHLALNAPTPRYTLLQYCVFLDPRINTLLDTRHFKQTSATSDLSDNRHTQEPGTRPDSVNWHDGPSNRSGATPIGASPTNLGYTGKLMWHGQLRSNRLGYSGELMWYNSEAVPRWDDRDKLSFFHLSLLYFVILRFMTSSFSFAALYY
jgi:hypothetical protein